MVAAALLVELGPSLTDPQIEALLSLAHEVIA
jgi:hypothetical protein